MAINRQDYQYVYNTLPGEKIPQDDGTLKVGAVVENLLPRLGDDTVYNPELADGIYADRDVSKCWTSSNVEKKYSVVLDSQNRYSKGTGGYSYNYYAYSTFRVNAINAREIEVSGGDNSSYSYSGSIITIRLEESLTNYEYESNDWSPPDGSVTYYALEDNGSKTRNNGELQSTVVLTSNTQYVIQVVNAYRTTNVNTIITPSGSEISFDSYLCFNASEDGEYIFKINGLSFGCKVYGLDSNNNVIELRNYIAPSTAQVYLFESDKPWEVDINGTITNIKDVAGGSVNPTAASGVALTAEEIENMFFEAPVIAATENQLAVSIPNWSTVSGLYTTAAKPDTHKDLYLLTYRDCLTTENRRYNGTKLKVRRGLLRCIHKTMNVNNIKFNNANKVIFNNLTHPIITGGAYTISISDDVNDASNPKLWPHLGRNYSYGNQNWKEDMDKYTSVCFALGVKDENGDYKRISEFSRPVIVEKYFNYPYDEYRFNLIPNSSGEYVFDFISNGQRFRKIRVQNNFVYYHIDDRTYHIAGMYTLIFSQCQIIQPIENFDVLDAEVQEFLTNYCTKLNHAFQENSLDEDGKRIFDYYPQDSIYFIKK